jgi:hypothetical protein
MKALVAVKRMDAIMLITVRTTGFDPAAAAGGAAAPSAAPSSTRPA